MDLKKQKAELQAQIDTALLAGEDPSSLQLKLFALDGLNKRKARLEEIRRKTKKISNLEETIKTLEVGRIKKREQLQAAQEKLETLRPAYDAYKEQEAKVTRLHWSVYNTSRFPTESEYRRQIDQLRKEIEALKAYS